MCLPKFEGFAVKNVKGFMGRDCPGFEASLYYMGKRVGRVLEAGDGGPMQIETTPEVMKDLKSLAASLFPDEEYLESESMAVAAIVDDFETNKQLQRACKKKTLFVLKGDNPDTDGYRTVNAPYSDKVQNYLTDKYGNKIVEIVNTRWLP